jgi:DNA-binding transcriptional regulator YiaG
MLEYTQKHLTKSTGKNTSKNKINAKLKGRVKVKLDMVSCVTELGNVIKIPSSEIKKYIVSDKSKDAQKIIKKFMHDIEEKKASTRSVFDLFSDINAQYGEQGALLYGLRMRENLNQTAFAAKINITQPELSKMENGTRPIGKIIAKRLEKVFGTPYQLFL